MYVISSHCLSLTSPFRVPIRDTRRPGLTEPLPVGRENWTLDHIHTVLTTEVHGGPPGWGTSSRPGSPPWQHEHEGRYTPVTHIFILKRRIWKDDYEGQMIFGELMSLKIPDICLTGEEKPRKKNKIGQLPRLNPGPSVCYYQSFAV